MILNKILKGTSTNDRRVFLFIIFIFIVIVIVILRSGADFDCLAGNLSIHGSPVSSQSWNVLCNDVAEVLDLNIILNGMMNSKVKSRCTLQGIYALRVLNANWAFPQSRLIGQQLWTCTRRVDNCMLIGSYAWFKCTSSAIREDWTLYC